MTLFTHSFDDFKKSFKQNAKCQLVFLYYTEQIFMKNILIIVMIV